MVWSQAKFGQIWIGKSGYNINLVAQLKVMVAWIKAVEKNSKNNLGVKLITYDDDLVVMKGSVRYDTRFLR